MKNVLSFLLGMVLLSNPLAMPAQSLKLDELFTELQDKGSFNGNVIVAKKGEILYQRSYGFADFETQRMLHDSSVFELASVSKQFTAMAIMMLAEQEKLNFDDGVSNHLVQFPYENISIHQLLTHTAGVPEYLYFADRWDAEQIAQNEDILAFLAAEKPGLNFEPGTDFDYSNTHYVLLAMIVEAVSGQPFGDFLQTNIFQPLGMRHTRSYTTRWTENEEVADYAMPHISYTNQEEKTMYVDPAHSTLYPTLKAGSAIEGDGSIVSTTSDLVRWYEALRTNQLVSAAMMEKALTPAVLKSGKTSDYGYGFYLSENGKKYWHWGSWPGVQTSFTFFPKEGIVAIYLKNVESNDWSWLRKWEKYVQR